ncbi:ComF family protein [Patescibacteria group bacterium]|nr:ComF family protein [Patescibacteria group bacterium]MBU4141459.1 ComF family protein [Patescibacteria group bacterium]
MELNNIQNLQGKWKAGWALDLHTLSSTPLGDNRFETVRTEIGELLFQLKYRNGVSKIPLLAEIIVNFLKRISVTPHLSAIIPIPPSDTTRTTQPVYDIAKIVGEKLKLKVDYDYLLKIRPTSQLKSVDDPEERRKILADVFQVKDQRYAGKKVLLFDDLYRSGETLNVATQIITDSGHINNIYVLTITKTRSKK